MKRKKLLALLLAALQPHRAQAAVSLAAQIAAWRKQALAAAASLGPQLAAATAAEAGAPAGNVRSDLESGIAAVAAGVRQQGKDAGSDPEKRRLAADSLEWRAKQLALSAAQTAKVEAFRAGAKRGGRRVVRDGGTCSRCVSLQGTYDADNADCWWTHPSCTCEWSYADTGESADMSETTPNLRGFDDVCSLLSLADLLPQAQIDAAAADLADDDLPPADCFDDVPAEFAARGGKGNERVLLGYWAKQMPKEVGGSDFNDCVSKLRGKNGIKTPEALCNWLHQKSRGAPPGHAAGEKYASHSGVVEIGGVATFADAVGRYFDTATAEWVYPNALMWRAGDYPDKQYSMTREDNAACVAAFPALGEVKGNVEHTPFLAERAGRWTRAWIDPLDADVLRGEVRVPDWLDPHLTDAEKRPSVGWNRQTKLPDHFALTAAPRVVGAALFSAMQEIEMSGTADFGPHGMGHNTYSGQNAMQELHDTAARNGAVCNAPANMASKHEANAIQQAHDLASQHGAKCDAIGQGARPLFSANSSQEGKHMSVKDKLIALFGGNVSAEEHAEIDTIFNPKPATFSLKDAPEYQALQERIQVETAKRVSAEATAFADGLINAGREPTNMREALIAKFSRATTDDMQHGTANFSGYADTKSRVDELIAEEAARPAIFAKAKVQPNESRVLDPFHSNPAVFSGASDADAEEARKARADTLRQTDAYKSIVKTA